MGRKKVPEQKDKSLEDIDKERLQAEIKKLQTETKKLDVERKEIEKRVNQKGYDFGLKIIGLIILLITVGSALVSIIIPLTQSSNQLADYKIKLAEAKLDSALSAKDQAEAKEQMLREQAQRIVARLDSINQLQKTKLGSLAGRLEQERTKSQRDQKKIKELESQKESLTIQIKDTESEKEQIERIVTPTQILSGRVMAQEDGSKIPLKGVFVMVQDGSVKDTTDEHGNFRLEIPLNKGAFERVIFSKPGYTQITRNLKLPNQNIEENLEKAQ